MFAKPTRGATSLPCRSKNCASPPANNWPHVLPIPTIALPVPSNFFESVSYIPVNFLQFFNVHMNIQDGRSWLVAIACRRDCVSRNHSYVRIFLPSSVYGLLTKTFQDFPSALAFEVNEAATPFETAFWQLLLILRYPISFNIWLAGNSEFDTTFCYLKFTLVRRTKIGVN